MTLKTFIKKYQPRVKKLSPQAKEDLLQFANNLKKTLERIGVNSTSENNQSTQTSLVGKDEG